MTFLEFVAATCIASYAMIGGAVLNAAITSPATCMPVLGWLYRWFRPLGGASLGLILFAGGRRALSGTLHGLFADPLFWIAIAQAVLLSLFALAQRFAIEACKGENDRGGAKSED